MIYTFEVFWENFERMNELCNVNRHSAGITITFAAFSTMYYFTTVWIHLDEQINEFIKVLPHFCIYTVALQAVLSK